jgi:hypothetical protein
VWGHHLNQRLSENHAGPFVFGATLGLHFAGNFVIKAGGVDCGLVTHLLSRIGQKLMVFNLGTHLRQIRAEPLLVSQTPE